MENWTQFSSLLSFFPFLKEGIGKKLVFGGLYWTSSRRGDYAAFPFWKQKPLRVWRCFPENMLFSYNVLLDSPVLRLQAYQPFSKAQAVFLFLEIVEENRIPGILFWKAYAVLKVLTFKKLMRFLKVLTSKKPMRFLKVLTSKKPLCFLKVLTLESLCGF